jgi:D-alanyl-D-alanine carboxypeptidase/D-alanyl-D-alanine-endopeptidase (penicillin-binding protein 4)
VGRWLAGGLALLVAVAALILALGGSLSHTSRGDATLAGRGTRSATHPGGSTTTGLSTAAGGGTSTATTPSTPTLTPPGSHPRGPAETRLRHALDAAMAAAGPHVGALVYDISSGTELYGVHAAVARPPASVEKLWTTTALLDRLGPDTRLQTSVLGTGRDRHGVWHGNLYLRGGGDPTFGDTGFNQVWNHGEGSTPTALVDQLRRRGIRRVTGRVYPDESLFDRRRGGLITDYKPDVPDFGGRLSALDYDHGTTVAGVGPAVFAARVFVEFMAQSGIQATAAPHDRSTPRTADLLATVDSPPMSEMVRLMNVPSDDLFAELFTKQLGVLFGGGGTITDGARVIARTIAADYALHPRILDGSGLGRGDRTSPLQIVELLRDLWDTRTGRELAASLPRTGVDGTVAGIGAKTAAQGRCLAKTGSLNYVTNLAGWCTTKGGQVLAFGLFLDGPDNATGFALESRMVGAIAGY